MDAVVGAVDADETDAEVNSSSTVFDECCQTLYCLATDRRDAAAIWIDSHLNKEGQRRNQSRLSCDTGWDGPRFRG